ncbi:hypothetical protein MTBUT4_120074 [Magnetospirillum sp. UT-4]|nr:hypothetical protein MTBUT4_120074 [Magnetospirillum sp. UT-4]
MPMGGRRLTLSQRRYRQGDRSQLRWDMVDLNSQIPGDHRTRMVWAFVEALAIAHNLRRAWLE